VQEGPRKLLELIVFLGIYRLIKVTSVFELVFSEWSKAETSLTQAKFACVLKKCLLIKPDRFVAHSVSQEKADTLLKGAWG